MNNFEPPPPGTPATSEKEVPVSGVPNLNAPPPGVPEYSPPSPRAAQPYSPTFVEESADPEVPEQEPSTPPPAPKSTKASRKSKVAEPEPEMPKSIDESGPRNCERCDFWKPVNPPKGVCRKYVPKVMSSYESLWPGTNNTDWCGEYRRTRR